VQGVSSLTRLRSLTKHAHDAELDGRFRGHRSGHYRRRRTSRRRRSRRFYNPFLGSSEPLLDEEVDSIVDLTAVGLGRFIPRIARVAQRTQPNIIIATGIYTYRVRALFLSFARAVIRNGGYHDGDVCR
jgi:hypothetical protein